MAFSAKARAASRNASWSSVRLKSIVQLPFSPLTQLDGEVGFGRRRFTVKPAGGDGLGFGVETYCLLAVSVLVAVERTLPAGEREERQGHRNGNVHSHLAHIDLVLEAAGGATVVGEDGGAVAIRTVVNQLNGFAKVVRVHAGEHRPENFFFIDIHFRRHLAEQRGPYPVTVRQAIHGAAATIQHQFRTLRFTCGNQGFDTLLGLTADNGAIAGTGVVPGTRAYLRHGFLEFRYPLLCGADKHRHGDRHAALAGGAHRGTHQGIDHLLLVGIRHDHHVVLGAGKALYALHVAGAGFVDVTADRYRTHKGNGLDDGIVQQGIYLLLGTVHYLQNALGRTGFFEQFRQAHRGERILLGRFQYKDITAGDGHGEHPQGNHGREVKRGNAGARAKGLDPGVGVHFPRDVFNGLAHYHGRHVGGMLYHFDTAPDIALGVVKGLAGFLGQNFGNLVVVFFQQCLVTQHDPGPLGYRGFFPALEHLTGVVDGLAHFVCRGAGHLGDDFVSGWVGHVDPVLGLALNKFTSNTLRYFFHEDGPCLLLSGSAVAR